LYVYQRVSGKNMFDDELSLLIFPGQFGGCAEADTDLHG